MDKLKLAHDWYMKHSESASFMYTEVDQAWQYADAMQAEAEKRNKAEAEQKRKEIREILNDANNFIEREGQHFDDIKEAKREGEYFFKLFCRQNGIDDSEALCEVDWSQAPNDAIGWMIFDGVSTWLGESGYLIEDAPSFGFTGTHIVERPHGF